MMLLVDMLPRSTMNDVIDRYRRHPKLFGQHACSDTARDKEAPNLPHIVIRKQGSTVGDATMIAGSSLGASIGGVICVRSRKQMRRVTTRAVVATVQSKGPIKGEHPVGQDVREPMGQHLFAAIAPSPDTDNAIAALVSTAHIRPARIRTAGAINLCPKTFNLFWGNIRVHLDLLSRVATPSAVCAARGSFVAPIIPRRGQ